MKRLLILALAAAGSVAVSPPATAHPRCIPVVCDLEGCYDGFGIIFCI